MRRACPTSPPAAACWHRKAHLLLLLHALLGDHLHSRPAAAAAAGAGLESRHAAGALRAWSEQARRRQSGWRRRRGGEGIQAVGWAGRWMQAGTLLCITPSGEQGSGLARVGQARSAGCWASRPALSRQPCVHAGCLGTMCHSRSAARQPERRTPYCLLLLQPQTGAGGH